MGNKSTRRMSLLTFTANAQSFGDATIRTKYQIRTKVEFGPKTNSDQRQIRTKDKFGPNFKTRTRILITW